MKGGIEMRDTTKCDFCEKPMVGYTNYQICFYCEDHQEKAQNRTAKMLDQMEKDRRQVDQDNVKNKEGK
jgi:hypothetical protein